MAKQHLTGALAAANPETRRATPQLLPVNLQELPVTLGGRLFRV
jgi:hypothetical protein